jgi:hypothetical protein
MSLTPTSATRAVRHRPSAHADKPREIEPEQYAVEWLIRQYGVSRLMAAALAPSAGLEGRAR